MTREDKRAYNYARDRLANDGYPVYSDEYELELAYKAGIEDAKNHPHWISVEEGLPEVGVAVLTITPRGTQRVGYYEDGWWLANYIDLVRMGSITHWMPLPSVEHLRETTKMIEKGGER